MWAVRFARHTVRRLMDLLYPPVCVACGAVIPGESENGFCANCRESIRPIGRERCPKCGFPFGPHVALRAACPACRRGYPFRQAVAVFRYDGAIREAVHGWKYRHDLHAGATLCNMFLAALAEEDFLPRLDLVVPVPLHWRRRWQRRFNQSHLLARAVGKRFGISCSGRILKRIRNTRSQVGLSPAERQENVRGAFRVVRPAAVRQRKLLIVDDVFTTGATTSECARVLRAAGAAAVYVATLAR